MRAETDPPTAVAAGPTWEPAGARMRRVARVLGDPARLRLVMLLRDRGHATVSELLRYFEISQPAVSHHLAVLRKAGVVVARREGSWVEYSLAPGILPDFARWLTSPAPAAAVPRDPEDVLYHPPLGWARVRHDTAAFGATADARGLWGQAVFVAAAPIGWTVRRNERYAVVESVTRACDLLAPLSGEVIAVNRTLAERPGVLDDDPYGAGWLVRVRLSQPDETASLLGLGAYLDRRSHSTP
jgi:glycine cleavage system H protein